MKAHDLQDLLSEIIDSHGDNAEIFFETPKANVFQPDIEQGWFDGDEDDDFPANSVVIPVKAVG